MKPKTPDTPETPKTAAELAAEQAATAVAAGIPLEDIPAAPVPAASEDADVTIVDEPAAPAAEANSGEPGDEETPAAPAEPAAEDGTAALLASINQQLVDARVELASAKAELATLQAGNTGFRKIAVEQTQRMRVAVGLSGKTDDLEKMGDAALATAHEEVRGIYMEKFNVGARSRTPDKEPALPGKVVTRIDNAVKRATAFK